MKRVPRITEIEGGILARIAYFLLGIVLMFTITVTADHHYYRRQAEAEHQLVVTLRQARVMNAGRLTALAAKVMPGWNIRAYAAGYDCRNLLVEVTGANMDDVLIDGLQYGIVPYDFIAGGVQQFQIDHSFQAVAYRDAGGWLWTYGPLSRTDAEALVRCRP